MNFFVTGDKFLVEVDIPLAQVFDPTLGIAAAGHDAGATGAATVVPTVVLTGLSFADGETGLLRFTVPQDYEEGKDVMALRLKVTPDGAGGTTDIGITTAQTIWRDGVAVITATSSAEAETAQAAATTSREVLIDISGRSFKAGDTVQLTLDVNAASDELVLNGISLVYGTCLAAYNDNDRFRALGTAEV